MGTEPPKASSEMLLRFVYLSMSVTHMKYFTDFHKTLAKFEKKIKVSPNLQFKHLSGQLQQFLMLM